MESPHLDRLQLNGKQAYQSKTNQDQRKLKPSTDLKYLFKIAQVG